MSGVVSSENAATAAAAAAKKRPHGGCRWGAGRKRSKELRYDPSHARRPELSYKHGVHVMLRTRWGFPRLRQRGGYHAIRRVLLFCLELGASFRVVHISIQKNHIHMIVEAADKQALRKGMQSFAIRAARALNEAFDVGGKVFAFRYEAKQIKTSRYARNAIAYVLNNWRRHDEDFAGGKQNPALLDAFSSAVSFAGWAGHRFKPPPGYEPLPVAAPQTALLRSEWRRHGLIDPFEVPGPIWH